MERSAAVTPGIQDEIRPNAHLGEVQAKMENGRLVEVRGAMVILLPLTCVVASIPHFASNCLIGFLEIVTMLRSPLVLGGWLLWLGLTGAEGNPSATRRAPATPAEAAALLDLRIFPVVPGAKDIPPPSLASSHYVAPGSVEDGFRFITENLTQAAWQEMPGGYVSEQAATGTFSRDGFKLSLSVTDAPSVTGKQIRISMINHGNVATEQLPIPPNTKEFYQTPVSSAYLTDLSVDDAVKAVTQLMLEQGWTPYGTAGDTYAFKQQGVKLLARVASAPTQRGKTLIDYSSQMLSADIPLPPGAVRVHYSDMPTQLAFDTFATYDDVATFYREAWESLGWKATTERFVKIDFRDFLIFRNPENDLLELQLTSVDGITRALVRYQTAAEVAQLEKVAALERQRREEAARQPKPKLTISLPEKAQNIESTASRVEFMLGIGDAKRGVE